MIPSDCKSTRVWLAGYHGASSLGRRRGPQMGHLVVDAGEVDFRLHRHEGAYGTAILSQTMHGVVGLVTYVVAGWEILQFVFLIPAIAGRRHDECGN